MLTRAGRRDISYCRQRSLFEIYKIFVQVYDVTGKLGIIEKTTHVKKRNPDHLRGPVAADLAQRAVVDLRVIILNIKFPGNTACLEPIKYCRDISISIRCGFASPGVGTGPVHVIPKTAPMI